MIESLIFLAGVVVAAIVYWVFDFFGYIATKKWKTTLDEGFDVVKSSSPLFNYHFFHSQFEEMYDEFPEWKPDNTFVLKSKEGITIPAGKSMIVGTGLRLDIPEGWRIKMTSLGGIAAKHGLNVITSPAYYNDEYSGEIKVILHNHDRNDYYLKPGWDIALASVERQPVRAIFEPAPEVEEVYD